jgi:N-methylhydantoinase A/oxoprolinase/acetone carboxylase beta subunit
VADALGIETVLVHPFAGVLSAYGMGLADRAVLREVAVEAPLDSADLDAPFATIERAARRELGAVDRVQVARRVHLRYAGTDTALVVPYGRADEIRAAFESRTGSASRSSRRIGRSWSRRCRSRWSSPASPWRARRRPPSRDPPSGTRR